MAYVLIFYGVPLFIAAVIGIAAKIADHFDVEWTQTPDGDRLHKDWDE
jgi:hypothetical protein